MSDIVDELNSLARGSTTGLYARCAAEITRLREALAKEREECAKVADAAAVNAPIEGEYWIAGQIGAAIRARTTP